MSSVYILCLDPCLVGDVHHAVTLFVANLVLAESTDHRVLGYIWNEAVWLLQLANELHREMSLGRGGGDNRQRGIIIGVTHLIIVTAYPLVQGTQYPLGSLSYWLLPWVWTPSHSLPQHPQGNTLL